MDLWISVELPSVNFMKIPIVVLNLEHADEQSNFSKQLVRA